MQCMINGGGACSVHYPDNPGHHEATSSRTAHTVYSDEFDLLGAQALDRDESEKPSPYVYNRGEHGASSQTSGNISPDLEQNWSMKKKPRRHDIKSILKIGIFSRCAESNYRWLVDWLKTKCLMRADDVHGVYITNNYTDFYSEIRNCSFAILYHTKKHGRLNITDVTDSLYDKELRDLSEYLGKDKVIVVIDDLQKTDSSEKTRILENQPSIGRLAADLFLFNERKDNMENLENIQRILRRKTQEDETIDTGYSRSSPSSARSTSEVSPVQQGRC
ncbi:hypothetical protein GDO81_027866 [Engystomops pustulosus]|uniref:Uncharacterized protein n=1 Tax=Engystomops pustulosus TaxID=76066 RepID=A0AAV6ZJH7_ENGPU|nr:hypothetical protein GDO81_027866 [Engystomops pustulosus]